MFSRYAAVGCLTTALASILCLAATPARADLVLETETAQIGKKGQFNVSNALQIEKDSEGKTFLTETQYEYALSDRSELLIEPFFYERQMPKDGESSSGVGDVEVTYSYMIKKENGAWPAILLAQKVKIPTATNRDIGTGKFDYQSYAIIGKTWGAVELNINVGYEFIGKVDTADLKNQVIYDASLDFPVGPKLTLFVEGYGNSSPEQGLKSTQAISFGSEYQVTKRANVFFAVGDDTDHLKFARIGLNYGF